MLTHFALCWQVINFCRPLLRGYWLSYSCLYTRRVSKIRYDLHHVIHGFNLKHCNIVSVQNVNTACWSHEHWKAVECAVLSFENAWARIQKKRINIYIKICGNSVLHEMLNVYTQKYRKRYFRYCIIVCMFYVVYLSLGMEYNQADNRIDDGKIQLHNSTAHVNSNWGQYCISLGIRNILLVTYAHPFKNITEMFLTVI
jgi:hypothetical protein